MASTHFAKASRCGCSRETYCSRHGDSYGHNHLQRRQTTKSNASVDSSNSIKQRYQIQSVHFNMARLQEHATFLRLLANSKSAMQRKLITTATKDQIDTLSEIALNFLKGIIPIQPHQFAKLKQSAKKLRHLASQGMSAKRREMLLTRKGEFLKSFSTLLIPLLVKV